MTQASNSKAEDSQTCERCGEPASFTISNPATRLYYCDKHYFQEPSVKQGKPKEEPIDTLDDLKHILHFCGCERLDMNCWYMRHNDPEFIKYLPEKQYQAIKELLQTDTDTNVGVKSEAEIRINELKWVFENAPYDDMRLWQARVTKRLEALESGTADTTGLASDKPSVRRATKFGKGK